LSDVLVFLEAGEVHFHDAPYLFGHREVLAAQFFQEAEASFHLLPHDGK